VLDAPRGVDIEQIVEVTEVQRAPLDPAVDDPEDWDWAGAWYVQARPIIHPVVQLRTPPPPVVLVALQDGRRWTLDVTHNPDPLSIAQTDLVHRVEAVGAVPWEARVIAGYLYTTPRGVPPIVTTAALWPSYTQIALRLAECLDPPPASLEDAIDRYVAFLGHWAELSATIAAHRPTEPTATHRPSSLEAMLLQAARNGTADSEITSTIGVFAPSWDVATPTFAERPGLLRDALARAHQALPHATPPEVYLDDRAATLNQLVADLAELDDHWFARAQWMVRKAILDRADALGIAREDAFWIPIDELVTGLPPDDARRRASGAQAAAARASSWNMPIVVGDPESSTRDPGVALRGMGSGHQITGRVRRFESLASAIVVGRGDIVVTRAVTPALAVIVIGCAAIISETGRLLDHGAAMARELGIPCIVGCRDAWSQLADGMIVSIDNDRVITR
jgi:phosphohistidine swiveling domain-containing protein